MHLKDLPSVMNILGSKNADESIELETNISRNVISLNSSTAYTSDNINGL